MALTPRERLQFAMSTLVVVAVGVRVVAACVWWSDTHTDPDLYVALAHQLARGTGLCTPGTATPTAYRPPGYPLLLATLINAPPPLNDLAVPFWNLLFDVATIGFVAYWLRNWSPNRWSPIVAVGLLAVDPLMVRYIALPMTEGCFTCWSTAAVLLLMTAMDWNDSRKSGPKRFAWGLAGVLFGCAALCRPSIWPFVGLISVSLLARLGWTTSLHQSRKQRLVELCVFWLTLAMTVSPWVVRNWLVLGQPLLTTTHGGYTLLLANNPVFYNEVARQPWGAVWEGNSLNRWQTDMLAQMDRELGPGATEIDKDRWQGSRARQNIAEDPTGFLWGMWYRFRSFWSLAPRGPASELPWLVRTGVGVWYSTLFTLALIGGVNLWRRQAQGLWVLLLFVFCLVGVHLVYWTDTRMRMPIHPMLAILASGVLPARISPATDRPSITAT